MCGAIEFVIMFVCVVVGAFVGGLLGVDKNTGEISLTYVGVGAVVGFIVSVIINLLSGNSSFMKNIKIGSKNRQKKMKKIKALSKIPNRMGKNYGKCVSACENKSCGEGDGCGNTCCQYYGIKNGELYSIQLSDNTMVKIPIGAPVIYGTRFRTPMGMESFMFVTSDNSLYYLDELQKEPSKINNDLEVTSCTFCQIDDVNLVSNSFNVWFIVTYRYTKKPQLVRYTWNNGVITGPYVPDSSTLMPTVRSLTPKYENGVIVTRQGYPKFYAVLDTVKVNGDADVGKIVEFSYDINNDVYVPEVDEKITFDSISYIYDKYLATTFDGKKFRVYDLKEKKYVKGLEGFTLVF